MPTGEEIREEILKTRGHRLGRRGLTTALAGATNYLVDALRFGLGGQSTEDYADAFLRITSVSNSDEGVVTAVQRIDPPNGRIHVYPVFGAAIVSGAKYELWRIHPDEVDAARDRALTQRCSRWRLKPLSILPDVSEWPTSAYSAGTGGDSNAGATAMTNAWPESLFPGAMVVSNSGANGFLSSRGFRVQPGQRYGIFGRVRIVDETVEVRVRSTAGTAVELDGGTQSFTGYGPQWFWITFTVPTTLEDELEIQLFGASATAYAEWEGVGVIPLFETQFVLEPRVLGPDDVQQVEAWSLPQTATGRPERAEIHARREPAGLGVMLTFDGPPNLPVYYWERHRFAALQADYMTLAQRIAGDAASTTCDLTYIEAATVVELLENMDRDPALERIYLAAVKDLNVWERRVGPTPIVVKEHKPHAQGVPLLSI